ncbi:hypothetical protein HK098_002376 [Nowakowskiella sp. JEL0407]|nr:hypothetical protein HK098_002376 [Nowakowskiella sp. JEL0407]
MAQKSMITEYPSNSKKSLPGEAFDDDFDLTEVLAAIEKMEKENAQASQWSQAPKQVQPIVDDFEDEFDLQVRGAEKLEEEERQRQKQQEQTDIEEARRLFRELNGQDFEPQHQDDEADQAPPKKKKKSEQPQSQPIASKSSSSRAPTPSSSSSRIAIEVEKMNEKDIERQREEALASQDLRRKQRESEQVDNGDREEANQREALRIFRELNGVDFSSFSQQPTHEQAKSAITVNPVPATLQKQPKQNSQSTADEQASKKTYTGKGKKVVSEKDDDVVLVSNTSSKQPVPQNPNPTTINNGIPKVNVYPITVQNESRNYNLYADAMRSQIDSKDDGCTSSELQICTIPNNFGQFGAIQQTSQYTVNSIYPASSSIEPKVNVKPEPIPQLSTLTKVKPESVPQVTAFSKVNREPIPQLQKQFPSPYLHRTKHSTQNNIDELFSIIEFTRILPYCDWTEFKSDISLPMNAKDHLNENSRMYQKPFTAAERDFYTSVEQIARAKFNVYVKEGTVYEELYEYVGIVVEIEDGLGDNVNRQAEGNNVKIDDDTLKDIPEEVVTRLLENNDDNECPICMDGFQEPALIKHCGHIFCRECLAAFTENANEPNCPSCRQGYNMEDIVSKNFFDKKYGVRDELEVPVFPILPPDGKGKGKVEWVSSTKIDNLMEILEATRRADPKEKTISKFLEFFVTFLELLEQPLNKGSFKFVKIIGPMSAESRANSICELENDDDTRIILVSLKCGSVGLNLVTCSQVVLMVNSHIL